MSGATKWQITKADRLLMIELFGLGPNGIQSAEMGVHTPAQEPTLLAIATFRLDHVLPLVGALVLAEEFMAGFEGDELQGGLQERLETIRHQIARCRWPDGPR